MKQIIAVFVEMEENNKVNQLGDYLRPFVKRTANVCVYRCQPGFRVTTHVV